MARKKLQKVFALLLTFSMLMSLLSVTAFAYVPVVPGVPENHIVSCENCGGTGEVAEYACPECGGDMTVDCTVCDGDGWVNCPECNGTGTVTEEQTCSACGGEQAAEGGDLCATCGGSGKEMVSTPCTCTEGRVACTECNGGQVACTACDGTGTTTVCPDCGGKGEVVCGTYVFDRSQSTATCAASGTAVYVCDGCGDVFTQSDVILDHEPTRTEVTTPATCTERGEETCYCDDCGVSYPRPIPALGHDLDENGHCKREGCDYATTLVGGTFKVDDCWEQDSGQSKFDNYSLTCKVLTPADENGQNGTVAVTGWALAEGVTSSTSVYVLIPETVKDDFGNEYTVTQVTASFQNGVASSKACKLVGAYLYAPVKELPDYMFMDQANLQILKLPDTLEVIGRGCFSGCKKLGQNSSYPVVLPEGLKEIGIGAFKSVPMSKQETLDIPASVTYIGTGAFENTNLKSITGGEGVTSLSSTVFQYSSTLKSVQFPNLTQVDSSAFFGSGITQVGWDWSKMTSIGESAFEGCYGLSGDLVLSGDCQLGMTAFTNAGFSSVTIGEGMTEIPDYAFSNCFNLTEINLPNSLTTIGKSAFADAGWEIAEAEGTVDVTVTIGSENGSKLSSVAADAFSNSQGTFTITVNTSEDSIPNAANLGMGAGNTVTFTVPSVEIDDGAHAAALQQLINDAAQGDGTVVLDKNYGIETQIQIPDGANITLTSENGAMLVADFEMDDYLFSVPAGSSLTLGSGLTFRLRDALLAESEGTLVLDGAASVGGTVSGGNGVVNITAGTFEMKDGSITGATITGSNAAAVRLDDGAEMTMSGGAISNNTTSQKESSGGVLVCEGATFTMDNGTISGNTAFRGGGVLVYGGVTNTGDKMASFTMNGGTISNNQATGTVNVSGQTINAGGGGVYVHNDAEFIMNGGTISGNSSASQGGGVATEAYYPEQEGGIFEMRGGTISGNRASNGGGIYSFSNSVRLYAGRIEGNTATSLGGGMYVSTKGYSIQLMNDTLITGNKATVLGGGVWSCPVGTLDFADGHAAIYGNTAGGAGDDVAAMDKATGTITTLGSQMPGGGVMAWYQDGSTSYANLSGNDQGEVASDSVRYADGDARVEAPVDSGKAFTAKAFVTSDAAKLAAASASLVITGNQASRGGGIGSNGEVLLDGADVETKELTVRKVWAGDENPNQPKSVTVDLVMTVGETAKAIDFVVLSADNNWEHTFEYAPQSGAEYSVREVVPTGYKAAITQDAEGVFVITNTYTTGGGGGTEEPEDPRPDPDPDPDDDTDIPDENTPTTDLPDPETPTTELPEEETPTTDIPEEETPLAEVPETGDVSALWLALTALSGTGLAGVTFLGRKKREDQ